MTGEMPAAPAPLILITDDSDVCGPDGCIIPANHPALAPNTGTTRSTTENTEA